MGEVMTGGATAAGKSGETTSVTGAHTHTHTAQSTATPPAAPGPSSPFSNGTFHVERGCAAGGSVVVLRFTAVDSSIFWEDLDQQQ